VEVIEKPVAKRHRHRGAQVEFPAIQGTIEICCSEN
jgi:hypothetical protein